jgi:hypothetical protein
MATTTRYGITLVEEAQSSKETTLNAAISALDNSGGLALENTWTEQQHYTMLPPANANEALIRIGSGSLTGLLDANGTYVSGNAPSGFIGNIIHWFVNGTQMFRFGSGGRFEAVSIASSGGMRGLSAGFAFHVAQITPASDANVTLTSSEYIAPILTLVTGAWTTGRQVILPNTTGGIWNFSNTSAYSALVKTSAGTGITVASNRAAWLRSNGTNILRMSPDIDPTV